jgi:Sec-independent protein translocase protein TatA
MHSNYREVLQQVKKTGGRFLEKIDYEKNIWAEVSDKAAREKVCQVLRDAVSAIRETKTQRSDRHSSSSSSSSEGSTEDEEIAAESESEGSTEDEESEVQTGMEDSGNHVWDVAAGLLPPVEAEIDGLFFQGDIPMPDFTPSGGAGEAASAVSATARENMSSFEVASNLCATNCDDFDLFEGELLKSFAVDEIFDVSDQNNIVHL